MEVIYTNPHDRPTMTAISRDAFFEGYDEISFHWLRSIHLDVEIVVVRGEGGDYKEVEDARWARRQFSSM